MGRCVCGTVLRVFGLLLLGAALALLHKGRWGYPNKALMPRTGRRLPDWHLTVDADQKLTLINATGDETVLHHGGMMIWEILVGVSLTGIAVVLQIFSIAATFLLRGMAMKWSQGVSVIARSTLIVIALCGIVHLVFFRYFIIPLEYRLEPNGYEVSCFLKDRGWGDEQKDWILSLGWLAAAAVLLLTLILTLAEIATLCCACCSEVRDEIEMESAAAPPPDPRSWQAPRQLPDDDSDASHSPQRQPPHRLSERKTTTSSGDETGEEDEEESLRRRAFRLQQVIAPGSPQH